MSTAQQPMPQASHETVVIIDDDGRELGLANKLECHRRPGRLHRALTCLLFDEPGQILFARRSPSKLTWPGYWDATVATHQAQSETDEAAASRRVQQELGVEPIDLVRVAAIRYYAVYSDRWCEREVCAVLLGRLPESQMSRLTPTPDEIDHLAWVPAGHLAEFIAAKPVAPWFHLVWEVLLRDHRAKLAAYSPEST